MADSRKSYGRPGELVRDHMVFNEMIAYYYEQANQIFGTEFQARR